MYATIFYLIYCIVAYIEYFPKMIKLIRTKSSNDYSLISTVLSLIGTYAWTTYVFITDQTLILYIGTIIDAVLTTLFVILVFVYHKNTTLV